MPEFKILLSKKAEKQLDKLSDHISNPIFDAISDLASEPRPQGYKKLKGRSGYRIRVGDYRIIYEIVDMELIIEVITVGHRKDIYD